MTVSLPSKVMLLGSGALKIGEAGEFDYSGSQCLKALEEEGVYAIVVNPNIATLQTDPPECGRVYFQPLVPEFVAPILEAERPEGILLSFGGQTALNCGVQLADSGALKRSGTRVLGTPLLGIKATEDRAKFVRIMARARVPTLPSRAVYSYEEAVEAATTLGYPVMVRVAYTLGGKGGGVARDAEELREVVARGLRASPVGQILLERYVGTFKQLEYEVVRDAKANTLTVCNMENVLNMRVHTGDNIVVAPSQTLTDHEYQMLRQAALRAADAVGIVGECNIQFCLDPVSEEYYAIEINARLSRSSALASKATGYPLAYVAAKLALGYTLPELKNRVTGVTTACFEPALDYVVVKLPRWDLDKFERADRRLGPAMKSVGEVMGIGASFPEAISKAVRMGDPRADLLPPAEIRDREAILADLAQPTPEILHRVLEALRAGIDTETIAQRSWIDRWFVDCLGEIDVAHRALEAVEGRNVSPALMRRAKELGLSDRAIGRAARLDEEEVRRSPPRRRDPPAGPDDRHARGRVAREDELPLPHLPGRRGRRTADAQGLGPRHRRRALPHRLERRVRLVDDEPRRRAEGGGGAGRLRPELEPRDRLHRLRPLRPALLRGDHARAGARPGRFRVVHGRRHVRRQPARAESHARSSRCAGSPSSGRPRSRSTPRRTAPSSRASWRSSRSRNRPGAPSRRSTRRAPSRTRSATPCSSVRPTS